MKTVLLLCILAILILIYPYARILVKRTLLGIRIKSLCHRRNYHLSSARAFAFLARNHASSYDFYIETDSEVLCVKLFAAKYKKSILKFTSGNRLYYFTTSLWLFSRWGQATMTYDSKLRSLPIYDKITVPQSSESKKQTNVLLIHPKCHEIHGIPKEGQKRILAASETIYDMRLESGKTFLEYLYAIDTVSSKSNTDYK